VYALQNPNKVISIVRKSFPALRATVMRDFLEVLKDLDLYNSENHNKTNHIYRFPNGTEIEFFSVDDEQKIRGRKRDICWCNEANELNRDEFVQLNIRTDNKFFCDFNPSDTEHWLYDLIERPDAIKLHSTYKDNPFLPKSLVKEIEELIKTDEDYYNIYALGIPSKSKHTIYNHQKEYSFLPEKTETILGLDFGYQHPTALVRCEFIENEVYVSELLYESYLTTPELIDRLKEIFSLNGLNKNTQIICDYARPEIIEDLRRNGFNCVNAIKNVNEGIDSVKSKQLFIHKDSYNLKKELNNYKWKMRGDTLLDEPIKKFDDGMDAMRYAVLYYKRNNVDVGGWDFTSFSI
jgi:phage terminase large subunit